MITNINEAEIILLVDFSNLAYISFHGDSSNFVGVFLSKLMTCYVKLSKYRPTAFVFAYDNFATAKREINPDYKSNRKKNDIDPRPELKKLIRYMVSASIEKENEEADDVIYSFIHKYPNKKIYIVSCDMDLSQCCKRTNVDMFSPVKSSLINLNYLYDKFGIHEWGHIVLWKTIFGDTSDNIKPVIPRIPKKLIVPLINKSNGSIASFYEMIDNAVDNKVIAEKWRHLFEDAQKSIEANWKIVQLNKAIDYKLVEHKGNANFLKAYMKQRGCGHMFNTILTGAIE